MEKRDNLIVRNIRALFDRLRPHVEAGGKWAAYHPVFDAFETVFFLPADVTGAGPHMRDNLDLKRFMSLVLVALAPVLLFGIYNCGYQTRLANGLGMNFFAVSLSGLKIVLPLIAVSYAVGFFWEFLFAIVRKHNVSEGLLVSGLLFPLTLPPTLPLWQAAIGISFGIVIGKEVFGGTGRNFLNPALTARAFIFFAYPAQLSGNVWTADAVSGATPLAAACTTALHGNAVDCLQHAGYSFSNLFFGLYPGSIGATSAFLCLLGAAFLIYVGVASYRTILGGIAGVLVTGYLLNALAAVSGSALPMLKLNPVYHLVMGGFAFGIAYMSTDPVSSPGMPASRWIYGFAIGMLTVLIRVFNPAYVEGVMLAILFMNLFAPLLDQLEIKRHIKKRIPNV